MVRRLPQPVAEKRWKMISSLGGLGVCLSIIFGTYNLHESKTGNKVPVLLYKRKKFSDKWNIVPIWYSKHKGKTCGLAQGVCCLALSADVLPPLQHSTHLVTWDALLWAAVAVTWQTFSRYFHLLALPCALSNLRCSALGWVWFVRIEKAWGVYMATCHMGTPMCPFNLSWFSGVGGSDI